MINPIHTYPVDTQVNQTQKTQKGTDSNLFKKALDKAVDAGESVDTASGASSAGQLSEISSIQNISLGESSDNIQTKTDELIEKLSGYSAYLSNYDMNLKEIEPLLDEIKSDAEKLLQETENAANGDEDSDLINIARHSAITANAEYIKFQRGDYL